MPPRAIPGAAPPGPSRTILPSPVDGAHAGFVDEWRAWRASREQQLAHPEGWLALVGLHWLAPGENRIAGLPGVFALQAGRLTLTAAPEDGYTMGGGPVVERELAQDTPGEAGHERLRLGTRTAAVIRRGERLALRVWDAASAARVEFRGVPSFPPDLRWRLQARWEAYSSPRRAELPRAEGPHMEGEAPGLARFDVGDRQLSLEPVLECGQLLFAFKDATAPTETYGGGRYLDAAMPEAGRVILDFNRAYNPPCAFTPYATCPLPAGRNVLPVRVDAGELRFQPP